MKLIPWNPLAINGARNLVACLVFGIYLRVIRHKLKFWTKKKYSMYELKIVRDYRDGKVTKEALDRCSTCDLHAVASNGLKETEGDSV